MANGYTTAEAEAVYADIEFFANYGFNKAHAADYAMITCQTAFLKAHHPLHFWAAMLSSEVANTEKLATYVALLTSTGFKILGPDINASGLAFTVEGDAIRVGLGAVKGVGETASQAIVGHRTADEALAGERRGTVQSTGRSSSAWCEPERSTRYIPIVQPCSPDLTGCWTRRPASVKLSRWDKGFSLPWMEMRLSYHRRKARGPARRIP